MSSVVPKVFKLGDPLIFDSSITQKRYIHKASTNGNVAANLNDSGQPITFSYAGENKWYNLSDPETGFWTTIGFITKAGTPVNGIIPNDRNANITLANMWWAHMFESARFRLVGTDLEHINNFGVAIETLTQLYGDEFRKESGELSGFIPDEGTGEADRSPLRGTVSIAAVDTVTAVTLTKGNDGFARRLERYNYKVDNNDTVRTVEVFIPLRMIFNCCTVSKLLKGVSFDIFLHRKPNTEINNIFFGATGAGVQFNGENGTGIQSMLLQLVEYIPHPGLAKTMEDYLESGLGSAERGLINWAYRKIECAKLATNIQVEISHPLTGTIHPDFVYVVAKGAAGASTQNGLDKNFSLCRNADVKSVVVDVDSIKFPDLAQNADFKRNNFAKFYQQFKSVCRANMNECVISATEYQNLFSIYAVDCTAHLPKKGRSDVNVEIKRNAVPDSDALPADTTAVAAINPRTVDWYFITLSTKVFTINCVDKLIKAEN